jgi:pyruvate ferredoxin oxidoreductase alpha subunit
VENVRVLAVLDRALSFGAPGGPLFSDINTVLYSQNSRPLLFNVIYGLGGRDMPKSELERIFEEALKIASTKKVEHSVIFSGVRE